MYLLCTKDVCFMYRKNTLDFNVYRRIYRFKMFIYNWCVNKGTTSNFQSVTKCNRLRKDEESNHQKQSESTHLWFPFFTNRFFWSSGAMKITSRFTAWRIDPLIAMITIISIPKSGKVQRLITLFAKIHL